MDRPRELASHRHVHQIEVDDRYPLQGRLVNRPYRHGAPAPTDVRVSPEVKVDAIKLV